MGRRMPRGDNLWPPVDESEEAKEQKGRTYLMAQVRTRRREGKVAVN